MSARTKRIARLEAQLQELSEELDALAAYMDSLELRRSPIVDDRQAIVQGQSIFDSQGCQTCHGPPLYTDFQLHDVGTGDSAKEKNSHGRGTSFDTPSLRGIWSTAPYFHDGGAVTLEDVLRSGTVHDISDDLDTKEVAALIAFMLGLPEEAESSD